MTNGRVRVDLNAIMFNPYENIVIGNFLYSLGLVMGRRPQPIAGCVNLLQQTPLDHVLGDVMLQFPGAWRLIEFKRIGARIEKEQTKQDMMLASTHGRPDLLAASRAAHWYVISGPEDALPDVSPSGDFPIRVRPYLDFNDRGGIPLDVFVESLVSDIHGNHPLSQAQLREYMQITLAFGGIRSLNGAGLLVGFGGSGGGLRYLPVPNIADLQGKSRMLMERMVTMSLELENHLERSESNRKPEKAAALQDQQPVLQQELQR